MAKPAPRKQGRPFNEIVVEGMDVQATAPPVDPDDASDLISAGEREAREREESGFVDPPASNPADDDILEKLNRTIERLAAQQEQFAQQQGAAGSVSPDMMAMFSMMAQSQAVLAAAIERMGANQMAGAQLVAQATKKANRPSNEAPPQISVFNPRGDKDFPKPPLKCDMFLPWPAEHESLDREEVELLNLLLPGDYVVVRNDKSKIKVSVRCEYKLDSDVPSKLLIHHDTAFNNFYHRMMPPLTDMLRTMLKQNPRTKAAADKVLTIDEEIALIVAGQLNDGSIPENGRVVSVGE